MPIINLNRLGSFYRLSKSVTYRQGRSDYYKALNTMSSIASLEALKKMKFSVHQQLLVPIRCFGIIFDASEKQIRQKLGKPNFRQQQVLHIPTLTTLFYKLKIQGIRCVLEIHLYQNAVFCLQLLMKGGSSKEKNLFLNSLARLYQQESIEWGNTFLGQKGNILNCENDVMPRITYLTGNQQCLDKILVKMQPEEIKSQEGYSIRQLDWRMS